MSGILRVVCSVLDNPKFDVKSTMLLLALCKRLGHLGDSAVIVAVIHEFEKRRIPLIAQVNAILISVLMAKPEANSIKAMEVFSFLEKLHIWPNQVLYHTVIRVFACKLDEERAMGLFNKMKQSKLAPRTVTYNVLIKMYIDMNYQEAAYKLYEELKVVGLKPEFNTLLFLTNNFSHTRSVQDCTRLLKEIIDNGVRMDTKAYTRLINLFIKCRDTRTVWMLFGRMDAEKVPIDSHIWKCLGPFFKENLLEDVYKFLDWTSERKVQRTSFVYEVLASWYGNLGDSVRLSQCLHDMQRGQVVPSDDCMLAIENACLKSGMALRARAILVWRGQVLTKRNDGDINGFWQALSKGASPRSPPPGNQ